MNINVNASSPETILILFGILLHISGNQIGMGLILLGTFLAFIEK